MQEVFLHGNAGKLQGYYTAQDPSLVALILPPHPLHKGTMQNKVVVALYESFVKNNFSTLRINFRGVQKSSGEMSKSNDSLLKDANDAISWLDSHNPFLTHLWVAGFSFGSWLSMNLAMRRPEITGFIGICPPTKDYDFSFIFPCTIPGLIINAENDILAKEQENTKVNIALSTKIDHFESHTIADADYKLSKPENIKEVFDYSDSFLSKVVPTMLEEDGPHTFSTKVSEKECQNSYIDEILDEEEYSELEEEEHV